MTVDQYDKIIELLTVIAIQLKKVRK